MAVKLQPGGEPGKDAEPKKNPAPYRKRATTSFEALQVRKQEQARQDGQEAAKKAAKEKKPAEAKKAKVVPLSRTSLLPTPEELRRRAKARYEKANNAQLEQVQADEETAAAELNGKAPAPDATAPADRQTGELVRANVRRALQEDGAGKKAGAKGRPGKGEAKSRADKLAQTATLSETTQLALAEIRGRAARDMPELADEVTTLAFNPRKPSRIPPLRAIGNLLYTLGYAGELRFLQVWRVVRDGGIFFGQVFAWMFAILFGWLVGLFRNMGRDIAAPFVNFARRRRQVRRIRERERRRAEAGGRDRARGFLGVRMRHSLQFVASIAGILLPLAALAVLGFTVYNVVSMDYALAVEMNGEVIGYVSDQTVVEGAKGLLRDKIKLARGQDVTDWQLNPTYTLARTNSFTNTQQLANQILRVGTKNPDDLVEATGIYIDGALYAVTDRGEELKAYLDGVLQRYQDEAPEGAVVDFVMDVTCEPESGDLYFTSSLWPYDELMEQLTGDVTDDRYAVANGAETLADIARKNGIALDVLQQRNPEYGGAEADYVPPAGKSVLIRKAQPFLQVKATYQETYNETITFETEIHETMDLAKNVQRTVQAGVDGLRQVTDELIYIDGELMERRRLEDQTVMLSEPVTEIINLGTYVHVIGSTPDGFGAYIFPAPDSTWGSRGISSYHRGVDINGPVGLPIYAANYGEVVFAGWHYSWGYNIVIQHPDGMSTRYAHCSSLAVEVGQMVRQGEYIAAMGSTGNSSGSHLHLEFILPGGAVVNPFDYVAPPDGWRLGWR